MWIFRAFYPKFALFWQFLGNIFPQIKFSLKFETSQNSPKKLKLKTWGKSQFFFLEDNTDFSLTIRFYLIFLQKWTLYYLSDDRIRIDSKNRSFWYPYRPYWFGNIFACFGNFEYIRCIFEDFWSIKYAHILPFIEHILPFPSYNPTRGMWLKGKFSNC